MTMPFRKIITEKEHGFTLIELIVVIIIVGILAAVGMTQYGKMVEKSRGAEARMILGNTSKLAYEYWLQNGTFVGLSASDINVGSGSDQIPSSCRSSYYFWYLVSEEYNATGSACLSAGRCTSGGKTPQGPSGAGLSLCISVDGSGPPPGWRTWNSSGGVGGGSSIPY